MDEPGRLFREAWIKGVKAHYPGTPKDSYIKPWEKTDDWERQAAAAVETQVKLFIHLSDGKTGHLTRDQKGCFVNTCWIPQIFKNINEPKANYVADWADLPEWQQQTDADIFEAIERA